MDLSKPDECEADDVADQEGDSECDNQKLSNEMAIKIPQQAEHSILYTRNNYVEWQKYEKMTCQINGQK